MQKVTEPPEHDTLFKEVFDYCTLEAAYEAAFLYLDDDIPYNAEEWLINLQNHLVWGSYGPGENPNMDVVVLSAIDIILKRYSLRSTDAGEEIGYIVDYLTLV